MLVIWYERASPLCEIRCGGSPAMSSPSSRMRPLVGRSTPVTQLKNVLLPAPLGPMMARTSPRGTDTLTPLTAVRPPKRMVSASVRRMALALAAAPRSVPTGAPVTRDGCSDVTRLGELARRRDDRLFLGDDVEDLELAVAHLEDELAHEGLVVLLAERLVALREVVGLLDLHALEGLDELHAILAPAELRPLHAELEEVDALEVGLHVAVGQRHPQRSQARDRVVEELLVVRGVELALEQRNVAIHAHEPVGLGPHRGQAGGHRDGAVAGDLRLLGNAQVVALVHERDALRPEEDPEEAVEVPADLTEEGGHVRGGQRNAGGAGHFATVLLDLLDVGVLGRLAPRVVRVGHVPLLGHL